MKDSVRCYRGRRLGFTLLELLVTIAILAILASIFFGIQRGVFSAQSQAKARAEMAVIAGALEEFKSRYGDYPWTDRPGGLAENVYLHQILTGKVYLDRGTGSASMRIGDRRPLMEMAALTLEPINPSSPETGSRIVDPWDGDYVYYYRRNASDGSWENPGFILLSKGENGEVTLGGVDTSGIVPSDFFSRTNNHDVIIYGYDN
jgi:prepilin-type N-terminal cleavage/methylation domain-containing protein